MVASGGAPRTLTQMLREWDDAALVGLLLSRPDLAFPPPTSFSQIASRATTRHSVSCAVDSLTAFELEVAERAGSLSDGFAATEVADPGDLARPDAEQDVLAAVQRLLRLAVIWGAESCLRPVRALPAVLAEWRQKELRASASASDLLSASTAGPPDARPPGFPGAVRQSPSLVDKVAAGSAFELVRRVDVLVEHCDSSPVQLRRDGLIASRELKLVATALDVPAAVASVHVDIAEAAGLLGLVGSGGSEVLVPTEGFDAWQASTLAEQWTMLVQAWIDLCPGSGPGWLKRLCVQAYGDPVDGLALSTEEVRAWVLWHRPRARTLVDRKLALALDQATSVGLLGVGALASFAPALDASGLDSHLPSRTDQVVLQADLTAIAPAPLTAQAAKELGAMADIESRGGATVYRFSAASVQRALASGWEAAELVSMLEARSRTSVPQPLRYLVNDLDRRRGVTSPRAEGTDATSRQPERQGAPSRRVRSVRPAAPRGTVEADASPADRLDVSMAETIVAALRSVEAGPSTDGAARRSPESQFASPIDTLREAVESGEVVWISAVDSRGAVAERWVHALSVDAGTLRARDTRSHEALTVQVRRITGAHIVRSRT